jgi:hypothetical protein
VHLFSSRREGRDSAIVPVVRLSGRRSHSRCGKQTMVGYHTYTHSSSPSFGGSGAIHTHTLITNGRSWGCSGSLHPRPLRGLGSNSHTLLNKNKLAELRYCGRISVGQVLLIVEVKGAAERVG